MRPYTQTARLDAVFAGHCYVQAFQSNTFGVAAAICAYSDDSGNVRASSEIWKTVGSEY